MVDLTKELHEQLDFHWQVHARPRLEGLTDEEYRWEPVAGAWNVRRREDAAPATATARVGGGQWLLDDYDPAAGEPHPAPVTTIAWRLFHIVVPVLGMRTHSHFDGPAVAEESFPVAGTAAEGLRQLDEAYAAWSAGVCALSPEKLAEPVGPAEGDWAQAPMITLVLHINREVIHHLAEVALLRDLWAHGVR